MALRKRKFDAERYWSLKPLCTVCKSRKVKSGTICWECKMTIEKFNANAMRENPTNSKIQKVDMVKSSSNQSSEQSETITPVIESGFNIEASTEAQNKIVRLFTYLEKALSLDDTVVRDFRTAIIPPAPWWLAEYPRDLENLYIRSFDTGKGVEEGRSHTCIKVQKKSIEPAPSLPERIAEWVSEITPLEKPQALEKIDRKVRFDSDKRRVSEFNDFRKNFEQGDKIPPSLTDWVVLAPNQLPRAIEVRYIPDYWSDHPELVKLLAGYTESDWKPWSERVNKVYKANLLYDQLYALRLLLKNEGDNYELLLGHGLLTWKHRSVGKIYAPVFLTPLVLDFDAAKRTIEISPDPMFRNFVEITPVSEMDNPAEIDLDTWMGVINTKPFDFWHFESLKSQANAFLNSLSPDSEDRFEEILCAAPIETNNPSIWNAPVIFVRKRTNSLWSKYAEKIRRDIEQNAAKSTEFINDLIGEYDEQDSIRAVEGSDQNQDIALKEAELFFPLPWNDEQKRIAERLETNYGVVVKGPPGTGKSHTIANLIARFLSQGKTVLVTSQTSKALEVLRDKLPENIRSLAVSQLQQTARRDEILQQSIAEISSNFGERYTKFSESKAESVRKELARTREEKAAIANKIRQYILTDSTEKLRINSDEISPMEAARLVSEHSENENLSWFTDDIHFDTDLNFTTDDLKTAYRLLLDLNKEDRNLHKFSLPDLTSLPNEDVVLGAFSERRELNEKSKISEKIFGSSAIKADQDELEKLWEMLNSARKVLVSINTNYEREIFDACIKSKNEREKWTAILNKIVEKTESVAHARQKLIGHEVIGSLSLPINDLVDAAEELKIKAAGKTKLGALGRLLLSTNAKKVLEAYKVDGRSPDSSDRAQILYEQISAEQAEKEIKTVLNQSFNELKGKPDLSDTSLDIVQLEILVAGIKRLSNYHDDFLPIQASFQKIKQLSDLSFTRLEDIDSAKELITSSVAKFGLANLEKTFSQWVEMIDKPMANRNIIREKLIQAIEKRNGTAWKKAIEELVILVENKEHAIRLNEIAEKIKKCAPNLYQDIVGLADQKQKFNCPDNLELTWKIARLKSWLDEIHNHTSVDELQGQHERLTKKEFQLNAELITILAWQRQIDKVTKRQRDALVAWSQIKIPKTGKFLQRKLRHAQEALSIAKDAVPVWIMPLYRVAQMFSTPKAGMFDVVIVDEASQCDLRGLMIGHLGKKLLVVGDPEQISPAGIFEDKAKNYELISRYLYNFPLADRFSIENSLFHLAEWRIKEEIMLKEHFRSVPEIIAFSNHCIYKGDLKPLRHPHPKGLLKPALVPIFVEGGYRNTNNKANEPEAKAIVDKIAELVEDLNYQQRPDGNLCTFGVISLLADDQAKYIKDLLLKHPKIGEKVIEERNITCGDAYAFQGDERDVIFLSMVSALDPNNITDVATASGYTDDKASQRFNVAATRGRDQVFLYHSIPLNGFRNQNDWRFKLLNWYYNPKTEELEAGRAALKKEYDNLRASKFSVDVGNLIIDRGYRVIPEYPIIGRRIDLVIQGENARLAVECDGDEHHTLENFEEHWNRQKQLERAGWIFWRVSGSSFYRHKEKALNSLWEKLDELGIKPIVG